MWNSNFKLLFTYHPASLLQDVFNSVSISETARMYYLLKYYDRQGNTSKININNINKKERHINTVRIIHLQVWMNIKIFETLPVFS